MKIVKQLDLLIRSGEFDQAEKRLSKIGKVERQDAVAFANIARRLKREDLAAKILNPIVRSTNRLQSPATPLEKLEYADVLRQLGAIHEARTLLKEIDPEAFPQALLFEAFCHISEWRYEEALVVLHSYLQSPVHKPYDRIVASINIAASLIQIGSLDLANDELSKIRKETFENSLHLLYGNCLELSGQLSILTGNFDQAIAYLEQSAAALKKANKASLQTEKWLAIATCLNSKQDTHAIDQVLETAKLNRRWEIVRDCELYIAFIQQDLNRYRRLYFGTPYENFRQRIHRFAGEAFEVPAKFLFSFSSAAFPILDLSTGRVRENQKLQIPLGQAMHRLLIILCRDLYKSVPVMTIFSHLFPDEFMNATTSANRVHQIIKRSRQQLKEMNLPLDIEEMEGTYRIAINSTMGLLLPKEPLPLIKEEIEILFLENEFGLKPFKSQNAQEALARSATATNLLLLWGIENGRLKKTGLRKSTKYQIVPRAI